MIKGGVTIGDGAIVAMGSIVTKDLPSNTVCVGSPCKVLRQVNENDRKFYYKNKPVPKEFL